MLSSEERFPFPEMQRYIEYLAKYRTRSRNTLKRTTYTLSMLGRDLVASYNLIRLSDITKEQIANVIERYASGRSEGTLKVWIAAVQGFMTWCCKEQILPRGFDQLPTPSMVDTTVGTTPTIIMPKTIFKMRLMSGIPLRAAMAFELLLSSGMRWSEFIHVRPVDIDIVNKPLDISTGKVSVCVGGQIPIKRERQSVKNSTSRIVLFSTLACRLIRQHMEVEGLLFTSRAPLYPYPRKTFDSDMNRLKELIPELRSTEHRTRMMNDTRIEDFGLSGTESEEFKRQLENRISRDNSFVGPVDPYANREVVEKTRGIHPHKMRHCFTCFQYYRNYYGTQHDLSRVQQMIGHLSASAIYTYLTQINAIANEQEWRRLWIGTPQDWRRLL